MCERIEMKAWLGQVEAGAAGANRGQASEGKICGNCSTCRRLEALLDPLAQVESCSTAQPSARG